MRRIDRYWKRCAAGMMAALMLMTAGEGGFTSFAAQPQFPFQDCDQQYTDPGRKRFCITERPGNYGSFWNGKYAGDRRILLFWSRTHDHAGKP